MSSAAVSWCTPQHESLTAQHLYDASNTFQMLFNMVLSDLFDFEAYLENIVIYFDPSDTRKSSNKCLSGLVKKHTLNLAKCEFSQAYVWNLVVQGGGL